MARLLKPDLRIEMALKGDFESPDQQRIISKSNL